MPALTIRISDELHHEMKIVAALHDETLNKTYTRAFRMLVEATNISDVRNVARTKKRVKK